MEEKMLQPCHCPHLCLPAATTSSLASQMMQKARSILIAILHNGLVPCIYYLWNFSSFFINFFRIFLWSSRKLLINSWYFNFKIGKVDSKDVRLSGNPVADLATGGLPRFIIIARLCNIQIDFEIDFEKNDFEI